MKMESAARGGTEINGVGIYKMGTYSFKSLTHKRIQREDHQEDKSHKETSITCYSRGNKTSVPIYKHKLSCPERTSRSCNYNQMGHFSKFSKSTKDVRKMGEKNEETRNHAKDIFDRNYDVNLFRTTTQYVISKLKFSLIILFERL